MIKAALIAVPVMDPALPPGALAILASGCESINAAYQVFDLNLYMHKTYPPSVMAEVNKALANNDPQKVPELYKQSCSALVDQLVQYRPTHIAISVFTFSSILAAHTLITLIQQTPELQGTVIVLGGNGLKSVAKLVTGSESFGQYYSKSCVVIYGDGDVNFVNALQGKECDNITQILNLNDLPIPSYKNISPSDYLNPLKPTALITGSRGCVRDCSFCDIAAKWPKYVYKTGQRIADEMLSIWKDTQVNSFTFSDSLLNGNVKEFRALNQILIKYRQQYPGFCPVYRGQFICRPSVTMRESDYKEMADAGCEILIVGIESFSESVRDHMGKSFDNDSIDWHFEMTAKYGIKNVLLLISGYVTETKLDHLTTLDYLRKYQHYALSGVIHSIDVNVTGLEVSTDAPLYMSLTNNNDLVDYDPTKTYTWSLVSNPELTPKERILRSAAVIETAYNLGYNVVSFDLKLDRLLTAIDELHLAKQVFSIERL